MNKILLLIAFLGSTICHADILDELSNALKNSKTEEIVKFITEDVEVTITGLVNDESCSKQKTEQFLNQFFSKSKSKNFTIVHRVASKEGKKYLIGTLTTEDGNSYRVNILINSKGDSNRLQELKIERN